MKFKLIKYNLEDTIKMNLTTQSAQRVLKERFGLFNSNFDIIFNSKYIENYLKWDEEKRKQFIIILGGKVNFKKTKFFIENKLGVLKK